MHIYRLSDPKFYEKRKQALHEGGVVYVIRCLAKEARDESGPFVPVPRIIGEDSGGILYIGKAKGEGRLAQLLMSIDPRYKGFGHSLGGRYKADKRFGERFPYADIVVELIPAKNPDATELEWIARYEAEFGELPPFNHSKRKEPNRTVEPTTMAVTPPAQEPRHP